MGFLKKAKENKLVFFFISFCPGLEGEIEKHTNGLPSWPRSGFVKAGSADSSVTSIYLSKCFLSDKAPWKSRQGFHQSVELLATMNQIGNYSS